MKKCKTKPSLIEKIAVLVLAAIALYYTAAIFWDMSSVGYSDGPMMAG